jgi:hypothetical protein
MAINPSLLIVPYRYKAAKLYSQLPESGAGDFVVTRGTTATRVNASGVIESVASGVPRLDYTGGGCPSLLVEPAATNLALHSRDLTNAAWVKSNITANKTALGADAVASGATTLTASAASGTVLQTITSASSARIFSAYVRRRTGTGVVQITQDNGTTWTPISLTGSYSRFATPTGTITNPVVGFRILTSGDEIDVDFTQQEIGAVATSAIPTVASTVTRNADVISLSSVSGLIGQTEGTIYVEVAANNFDVSKRILAISDGTVDNRIVLLFSLSKGFRVLVTAATAAQVDISTANNLPVGNYKIAFAYATNNFALYVNGALIATDSSGTVPPCTDVFLGKQESSLAINQANDRISAAAIYTSRLSNSELASLTQL